MKTQQIECPELSISVTAHESDLAFLDHYVHFSPESSEADCPIRVTLRLEKNLECETKRLIARSGSPVPVKAHQLKTYARFAVSSRETILIPIDRDFHYITRRGSDFTILASNEAVGRKTLLRLVRSLIINGPKEWTQVHAALLELGENGVLLCGPSGSGKTSILLALIQNFGAHFGSGDRVLLDQLNESLCAFYVPLAVRWIPGQFPAELAKFQRQGGGLRRPEESLDDKVEITPKDLVNLFKVGRIASSRVSHIFFIEHEPKAVAPRITQLEKSVAIARLESRMFPSPDPIFSGEWLDLKGSKLKAAERLLNGKVFAYSICWSYPQMDLVAKEVAHIVNGPADH